MNPPLTPYFDCDLLKAAFAKDIHQALSTGRISEEESGWLQTLLESNNPLQKSPRVDRLEFADSRLVDSDLVAALLISHEDTDEPRVYLYSLLSGIEPFDNRECMLEDLQSRFESADHRMPGIEVERLENPVFEFWMSTIIDIQVEAVDGFFQQVEALPSLRGAMTRLLQQLLKPSSSQVAFDLGSVFLQIAQPNGASGSEATTEIIGGCSLLDAALNAYAGNGLALNQSFIVLDAQGKTLDENQARPYTQALIGLAGALKTSFEHTLREYWLESGGPAQSTRKSQVRQALADSFRQTLLDKKANGALTGLHFDGLRALLPGIDIRNDQGVTRVRKLTVKFPGREPLKLVGMITVEFVDLNDQGVWLFSAETGLVFFENRNALLEHVQSEAGREFLFRHLSFNDHSLAVWHGSLELEYEEYEGELFTSLVDNVIGFQQRNVNFALDLAYSDRHEASVMIDDALDIRYLIDHRLFLRNDSGRWRRKPRSFVPLTVMPVETARCNDDPPTPSESQMASDQTWVSQLQTLEEELAQIRLVRPGIEVCAQRLLNKQLCVFTDKRLDACDIHLRVPAEKKGEPAAIISLVSWLLDRVSGARVEDLPVGTYLVVPSGIATSAYVDVPFWGSILNKLIKRAHAQFPASYLQQIRQFHLHTVRQNDRQMEPGRLSCDIRTRQLRLELALERRRKELDPDVLDMLQQLLDRPVQDLRSALGNEWVQVSSVSLEYDSTQPPVVLSNTFVFHQPAHADGPLVFWSAIKGLRVYDSLLILELQINRWLRKQKGKMRWQDLLSVQDAVLIDACLQRPSSPTICLQTQPMEGYFINELQQAEQHRQSNLIEAAFLFARRLQLDSSALGQVCRDAEAQDVTSTTLDAFYMSLQALLMEASLPDWIKSASNADLFVYCELLRSYFKILSEGQDFMSGIPKLKDFAREQLLGQLAKDFPDQSFEPDNIWVKHFRYVTPGVMGANSSFALPAVTEAYNETLTDFVLDHLAADKSFSLSVSTTNPQQAIGVLTPPYLNALARQLDIGASFQKILEGKLASSSPDYAKRFQDFCWQFPTLMLEMAFEQKIEHVLSDQGWRYIQHSIEMPDVLARQAAEGTSVVLRPFALIAEPGLADDEVPGLYLFGPDEPNQGPLVLHAIFHDEFCFREYANEAALLEDLRQNESLQRLILQRLSPEVRSRYDHGGFTEPHLPFNVESSYDLPSHSPAPVALSQKAVESNTLLFFFRDTLKVMKLLAKNQTVTTAQSDWSSFTYLMTLAGEQVLTFLPGRLGMAVSVWQSQAWFKASFSAATTNRWGKAVSEFSAGLTMLLSSRIAKDEELASDTLKEAEEYWSEEIPDFSWNNSELLPEVKVRLRVFEVYDVELHGLIKDPLLNLYLDRTTQKYFASVAGKVFQVRQVMGQWRIVSDHTDASGPPLRLNQQQRWELDFKWGLFGGGPIFSRSESVDDVNIDEVFITEATGMTEIRTLYRDHARRIGEAHLHAKRYLENALENLRYPNLPAALDTRVEAIIKDFFGVTTVTEALKLSLHRTGKTLFDELLDASLSPFSSKRFVTGINRTGQEQTLALTIKADPKRRIFLSERFFQPPGFRLSASAQNSGFKIGAHYRAAILIHELSHLALNTHDIAYVESGAPFIDLLRDNSLGGAIMKATIRDVQNASLSQRTPRDRLFCQSIDGIWHDLTADDGDAMADILKITEKTNLEDARDVFFGNDEKRWTIMLRNADSVALLMTLLGRTSFR